ncbi:truncated envelope glycoprotein [Human immunodeficiency virus 2]|uniref:Truncated envelope glycoprotein n=1 Tax=Human immunodeficiency virus 2 TaxID=11709 RepID=Q2PQS8_9HIV2|nr:truncated envelope glycoprotein [Human immunodeficiency virus 2]
MAHEGTQLLIAFLLTSACLIYCKQYVTVFYGIPAWKNASIPLFCATRNRDTWGTIQCLPDNDDYQEIVLNVAEAFDAWDNTVTEQAIEDVWNLFETSTKPCVKLTPLCVTMRCNTSTTTTTTAPTSTSAGSTATPKPIMVNENTSCMHANNCSGLGEEEVVNCEFNMTGLVRDKPKTYNETWYSRDVDCEPDSTTNSRKCYMNHCNTSVITESCDKHYWDDIRFRYCAPPGYALLRCNDTNYSGFAPNCSKVVASTCTRMMETQTSTWFGFNGTRAENRTYLYWHSKSDRTIISLNKYYNLSIHCKRPGNKTVTPITLMSGYKFHSRPVINTRPKQAWCWFKGRWKDAMQEVKKTVAEHPRAVTKDPKNITFAAPGKGSDPEVEYMWTNCRGEFLYCDMTWFLDWIENRPTRKAWRNYVPCHIRQIINTWHKVGKHVYLPPREGELTCNSTVTSIIANIDVNEIDKRTNITFSAEVAELYRVELGDYKLVEVTPIGFAPTSEKRYSSGHRETYKRCARARILGFSRNSRFCNGRSVLDAVRSAPDFTGRDSAATATAVGRGQETTRNVATDRLGNEKSPGKSHCYREIPKGSGAAKFMGMCV